MDYEEPSDTSMSYDDYGFSDFEEAEVVPSEEDAAARTAAAAALKSRIFAACAASDRGFAASAADRAAIEALLAEVNRDDVSHEDPVSSNEDVTPSSALLAELAPLSPLAEPTRGCATGEADAPLRACWRLVYTSASDVSTLAANPLAALGGIYQDARELPVIVNVIDAFPRALANLPPSLAGSLASTSRIKVVTRARPRSATRVGLSFEAVEAAPLSVLGQDVPSWLPPLKLDLPQLGLDLQRQVFGVGDDVDPRDADSNPAFFDVTYLDDEFLVIQQGSPGGMFAAIKVDELAN